MMTQVSKLFWNTDSGTKKLHIEIQGRTELIKVDAASQLLIQDGRIISPAQLKVGDQIKAYGFDKLATRGV